MLAPLLCCVRRRRATLFRERTKYTQSVCLSVCLSLFLAISSSLTSSSRQESEDTLSLFLFNFFFASSSRIDGTAHTTSLDTSELATPACPGEVLAVEALRALKLLGTVTEIGGLSVG